MRRMLDESGTPVTEIFWRMGMSQQMLSTWRQEVAELGMSERKKKGKGQAPGFIFQTDQ